MPITDVHKELDRALSGAYPQISSYQQRRASTDLSIAFAIAVVLLLLNLAVNFDGPVNRLLAAYFRDGQSALVVIINVLTAWLAVLLLFAFLRWRRASIRTRELEVVLSSISPDSLLVVNPARKVIMANGSVERMFGRAAQEVLGCDTSLLYADRRTLSEDTHEVHDALERDGFHVGQAEGARRDGTRFPLEIITGHLEGGGGAVLLLRDISERARRLEEKERLEERIARQQRMESLGALAGGVAHDFNNILSGILGHADILLAELPAGSTSGHSAEEIVRSANRAAALCREMLAYTGKPLVQAIPMDINHLVEDVQPFMSASVGRSVQLEYGLTNALPGVEGDPAQIRQILMNLVANASDAIGDTNGKIRVSTRVLDIDADTLTHNRFEYRPAPGRFVELAVEDDGCGMTETAADRIFEPFFTTKFTGHGLGLASVHGIIQGHGGALTLETEPGRGSRFGVLLPASDRRAPARQSSPPTTDWQGTGTVLIVDDEAPVLAIFSRMLVRLGFDTECIQDGEQAIERFRERADEFTLVILDLTMPGMSGQEVFAELKRINSDIPVLITSGYTRANVAPMFESNAPVGFLQKPFDRARLREALRAALEEDDANDA